MRWVIFVQRVCYFSQLILLLLLYLSNFVFFFFFLIDVRRPSLRKFYLDHIERARSFADRTFHFLVTLHRLTTWGLRPEPTEEALAHELTTHRRKLFISFCFDWLIRVDPNASFFFVGIATMKENKGKGVVGDEVT